MTTKSRNSRFEYNKYLRHDFEWPNNPKPTGLYLLPEKEYKKIIKSISETGRFPLLNEQL